MECSNCPRFIRKKQVGATLVELVIATPVLLMMGLGTVQMGLMYHAKTTLNYATFEAARVGAVSHAQVEPMVAELAYRLAPVHGGKGTEGSAGAAIASAMADAAHPFFGNVEILNPTPEMFDAWEMRDAITDEMQIPNHHLKHQDAGMIRAGVNIHDANLLKIKSEYGYQLQVPFAGKMISETLRVLNPAKAHYYSAGRIPITSTATIRMQNEARRSVSSTPVIAQTGTQPNSFGENASAPPNNPVSNQLVAGGPQLAECDPNGLGPVNQSFLDAVNFNGPSSVADNSSQAEGRCEVSISPVNNEGGLLSSGVAPCS